MVPAHFVVLREFPLNANGKVDRNQLPDPDESAHPHEHLYVAPTNDIEHTISSIWQEVLDLPNRPVGIDDNFFELGGDSMLSIKITALAAAKGIQLTVKHIFHFQTIRRIAAHFNKDGSASTEPVEDTEEDADIAAIKKDLKIDSLLTTLQQRPTASTPSSRLENVFLSGATGFIGAFLAVSSLQRFKNAKIHCLIRAADVESAKRRLEEIFARYLIKLSPEEESRVNVVVGDLAKPMFGLEAQTFESLARQVDLIIHCGAVVNGTYFTKVVFLVID
jgi:acyl carrier protein